MRFPFAILCALFLASGAASGQYELKAGSFNTLYQGGPPAVANPPATAGQSASSAAMTGSAGPISTSATLADRFPSNADNTLALQRASIGNPFAAGIPRYSLGDTITPPLVKADGVTPAAADYWRPQPVFPGEDIPDLGVLIPRIDVNVTSASTNSNTVTFTFTEGNFPSQLVVGATLLGQPVTRVVGTTVTLAGNASNTVTSSTLFKITPATSFYYSPHAKKVFAHQPGRVEVKWVSRLKDGASYGIRDEVFAVSANTTRPIRTIFWTEGNFDGPKVQITDGRITTVNPVYNNQVPKAVAEEVSIPGYNPTSPNLTTLSFNKFNGVGELKAYNVEGRILVEYLGNVTATSGTYDFVGSEIVEIKRIASVGYPTVHLGKEILPGSGSASLVASPVLSSQQNGASYYATSVRQDQTLAYFAERETSTANDPDDGAPRSPNEAYNKVVFYWLETADFNIKWPHHQDRYWLRWSPDLADYAHYTVDSGGSTPATGISFTNGVLPQLVYQDDPAQAEAAIDANTQRFHVNPGSDLRNRSLLKFSGNGGVWYVNVYTQAEARQVELASTGNTLITVPSTAGLTVGMVVTGPGITGTATIVSIVSATQLVLSQMIPDATNNLAYPVGYTFAMATSMTIVPGSSNPFFLSAGTWQVNGSATTATAEIESPELTVTTAGPVTLSMNHSYNFETGYDAGRLWVSRNGAAYSLVPVAGQGYMHGRGVDQGWTDMQTNVTSDAVLFSDGVLGDTYRFRLQASWVGSTANPSPNWSIASITLNNNTKARILPSTSQQFIAVASTAGLEVGMVVSGAGITGSATITRIINGTSLEISQPVPAGTNNLTYTVQSDAAAVINTTATVGTRLTPPAGHENAGYVSGGTAYYPAGYVNPFVSGVPAANLGAIIPVNARPGNNTLTVRWFKKIQAPSAAFQNLYIPGKIGRYTISYPATTSPQIVIAQGAGTDDLPPAESTGSVYYQNDVARPGYNPNEEHALMLGGRAYALRDDLNVTTGSGYTSEPFLLLAYTDPSDDRPAMHTYKVVRTDATYDFDYTATAGTLLVKPYPLPLMPLPLTGTGANLQSKDLEIIGSDAPLNTTVSTDDAYRSFTFQDRKGFTWIHRGPHEHLPPVTRIGTFSGGDADEGLDLDGTFPYAFNFGANSNIGTIRDAVFTADSASGITYSAPNSIPNWINANYGSSTNDDKLEAVMNDIRWANAPATVSVDLANLQLSGRYKLQLLFADTAANRGFDVMVEGRKIADDFKPGAVNNASLTQGTVLTYEFYAGDNTLNILLDGTPTTASDKNPILNGVTLERVPGELPILTMKLYYVSRDGFFIPGQSTQPSVGTILPFLRQPGRSGQPLNLSAIESNQQDEPLPIVYRPAWPAQAPELRVAETLTLPKFGLPQVRGQASASILYQQSIAKAPTASGLTKASVTLHDPTREKTVALDLPTVALPAIPGSIATTSYQGKTYFQGLPPHLQQRFYLDPLRGAKGTLVFLGQFHDEPAGEDYLDLNLLTQDEETVLKALASSTDPNKTKWDSAIDALNTRVETFKENPAVAGTYIVDSTKNVDVGEDELAKISSPDTAVDSYALTATGQGTGYVTMVFGNGRAFTPEGDPVQVKVFKIAPQLYTGDLKVISSSNPLDEQVTLRHSGDFAGKPEGYDFEWRWSSGAATAPAVYTTAITTRIGNPAGGTHQWRVVSDPGALFPTTAQYETATPVPLPRGQNVNPAGYTAEEKAAGLPTVVLKSESGIDFTSGVPGDIFFSASLGTQDGFVLHVNGVAAIAYRAPEPQFTLTNSGSGLSPAGLPLQFSVPASYFSAGPNIIEVAIYSDADANVQSTLDFRLEAATETDAVTSGTVWQTATDPAGRNTNTAIVGGSPLNPFGGSPFVLNDRWFTMRYKPKASANNVLGTQYSRWMPPMLVEGWVKRVLAAINPFEQRVKDLYNSSVNTDVSVLTQAGTRWEGDIALTLSNVNDVGLIEIYETVLNRAKSMSIDANTNDPDTNNALILAAGYLNDLYTLLGNEAYADAANPTISVDDQGSAAQVNTSRFSFEGQVASSLDEELALLRGRDDLVSPGVNAAPAYNRLFWNYTRGINSGEALYALNYNIREKVGSATANGVIDEADAQRMFPQGHGDSYGHYLTALKGYYKLLTNSNFTWNPRAEAVTVLGQPVTVDYFDERKFAAAAGNIARAAGQIIDLTWRKQYKDAPSAGWSHFRDNQGMNAQTGVTRRQGMDEWVSRSTQGALFNWAVANSLLPVEDTVHTGIQKIDRTTVPEIAQLPTAASGFQTTIDSANAHLNPLGLSPDAIAFDISPAELADGTSHYEQVSSRALVALNNAAGAFNQAAVMTGSLRNQEISLDDFNTGIVQQELAYADALVGIFGSPYSGDIGAGKTYAQGYDGPDLYHWFIVDRPNELVATGNTFSITIQEATGFNAFTGNPIADIVNGLDGGTSVTTRTVTVQPSRFVQYNDVWTSGGLGSRPETGSLQDALLDAQQTYLALSEAKTSYDKEAANLRQSILVFNDLISMHSSHLAAVRTSQAQITALENTKLDLDTLVNILDTSATGLVEIGDGLSEALPTAVGLAADPASGARGAIKTVAAVAATILRAVAVDKLNQIGSTEISILANEQALEVTLASLGFSSEEIQSFYEISIAYRDHVSRSGEIMQLTLEHQRAVQNVSNVLAEGNQILGYRELFRQRAAAIIQGYRTRDVTFRLFRNEALEQYRTLFDLASRYSYLAAKSYDYETGLLGTTQGKNLFSDIVSSRALGDLTDGTPQLTTSSLGDGGLANSMAKLNADFTVAKGRLGINNPDNYGTVFSLRHELFRIRTDASQNSDDEAWQQTLEQHITSNLLADSDVATYCRNIRKPNGTPVPGIIIPFSTTIQHGRNFFGLELAAGDHAYTPSNFATKIYSVGLILPGYVGMDAYASGSGQAGGPASSAPNALSATPYVYLIPCGLDYMLAPPLGDTNMLRSWKVDDQALPLPFNLGGTSFNSTQFFSANGTLTEQPWITRKHQAFRPIDNPSLFYGDYPSEFTNTRLIGRSVWNGQWKLVIPAYTLLNDEQEGLNRFAASVQDVQLFLRTYSNSGN